MAKTKKPPIAKLKHWQSLVERPGVLVQAQSRAMGEKALKLVDEGFEKERDPYGNAWKPKKKPDGRKILQGRTRRLRRGWRLRPGNGKKVVLSPSVDYAAPHQDSKRARLPRRRMVPSRRMPERWRRALRGAALKAAADHFEPKRRK